MDDYLLCERLKEIAEAIKAQNGILIDQREELTDICEILSGIQDELSNIRENGIPANV